MESEERTTEDMDVRNGANSQNTEKKGDWKLPLYASQTK